MKESDSPANQPKPDFAATIAKKLSHDVRSPFNATIGVLQLLVSEYDTMDRDLIRELLSTLLDSSREQLWYIDLLLYWTRLEIGEVVLTDDRLPLSLVLEHAKVLPVHAGIPGLRVPANADSIVIRNPDPMAYGLLTWLRGLSLIDSEVELVLEAVMADHVTLSINLVHGEATLIQEFPVAVQNQQLPSMAGFALYLASRIFDFLSIRVRRADRGWLLELPLA